VLDGKPDPLPAPLPNPISREGADKTVTIQLSPVEPDRTRSLVDDPTDGDSFYRYHRPWGTYVNLHMRAACPVVVEIYPDEDRAVVKLGPRTAADLMLYLPAAQIDRLIDILIVTRNALAAPDGP
jgi:hypothetical protein